MPGAPNATSRRKSPSASNFFASLESGRSSLLETSVKETRLYGLILSTVSPFSR